MHLGTVFLCTDVQSGLLVVRSLSPAALLAAIGKNTSVLFDVCVTEMFSLYWSPRVCITEILI